MLSQLSYASATESGSVSGYISPVLGIYDKQLQGAAGVLHERRDVPRGAAHCKWPDR